ncbi:MAG TPA: glycosyltransferase [Steroidobacteraceae bacterium]|nr:glycosyltransferase [Steroidobacteraceae bacterium]
MKTLLTTTGTRGDVQPLLALALQLKALGQRFQLRQQQIPGFRWENKMMDC